MPKIKAVTDEMMKRAGKIDASVRELRGSQQTVSKMFRNMEEYFSGKVPQRMVQHMTAMEKEYKAVSETLARYSEFLRVMAQRYEWTDAQAARWAAQLSEKRT